MCSRFRDETLRVRRPRQDGGDVSTRPEFSVTGRTNDDGSCVVTVVGELDVDTVGAFRDFLLELNGEVKLDCRRLSFIDSAGLGTLVMVSRDLDGRGGHLRLTNVSDACWKILQVTGLTQVLGASRVA